jgi:hypothetical protein
MSESFMGEVLEGTALWTEIDDWIDRWHEGGGEGKLHEFLGMSWDEYRLWAEQPTALRFIIAAHEHGEPVESLLQAPGYAIAARGLSKEDASNVRQWLMKTGRLQS